MMKPTSEPAAVTLHGEAQDNLAVKDPELERLAMLRMGATPEQAEEAARWAVQWNERHGFGNARAS
jgi:hypothetical protein